MKVLVAQFVTESNENIPYNTDLEKYNLLFGDECINGMRLGNIYEENDIELIPSIYADSSTGGVVTENAFKYIENKILEDIKKHLHEIDGIYFHLHGASEVEGIGSGDHHILAEVRKIVGPYLPIAIACDPHGNLCQEYVENAQIIRSYRESPHTDMVETYHKVSEMLIDLLRERRNIHAIYRKLPLILGGEQSVSTDEPVYSINKYMNKIEEDPRIMSVSWHVGYIRHDTEVAGCGIVVVPNSEEDQEYAELVADKLADFVFSKRKEFHYTGFSLPPDEAIKRAISTDKKPVFITDSGDNTTSGSVGANTFILKQVMGLKNSSKRFLFAAIRDDKTFKKLSKLAVNDQCSIELGMEIDELSGKVPMDVTIKAKGHLIGYEYTVDGIFGECICVSVDNYPIDIIIEGISFPYVEIAQFDAANVFLDEYDVIVVKQGYIFPELKRKGELNIMSLTKGATLQDTSSLIFKRIMRPMFPIDDI